MTVGQCDFKARAAIFDLDGTLLDTLEDLADSMNDALSEMGFPGHPAPSYRYFIGDGVEELARRVLPEGQGDDGTVELCIDKMVACYHRRWANKTRPYGGVDDLLDRLASAEVPMAVLSNKPHDFTTLMVSHFFPEAPFQAIVGAFPDRPKKPDPTFALEIAGRFGVAAGEILFLGDSEADMKTALAAGMFPAGAAWGFRGREELAAAGASALLEKPSECLEFFGLDGEW